jgi:hypothetical protein
MAVMTPVIVIAVLATVLAVVALAVRRSWFRWRAIAEEAVLDPLRAWLAPPQQVPLATLQRRWLKKALRHVTVTVSGKGALPGGLVFAVAPADIDRLGEVHALLAEDSATMLERTARRHDWIVPAGFSVSVEEDDGVTEGRPEARRRRGPGVTTSASSAPSARVTPPPPSRTEVLPAGPARTALTAAPGAGERTEVHVPCELISLDGGADAALDTRRAPVTIGRNPECDIRLTADVVSGVHASVACHAGQWILHDRSSRNGTWVNGTRVQETALLHNDEVSFGFGGPRFVFSRLSPDLPAVR